MSGVRFDPEAIRTLASILAETGLTEIEIAEKDSRIRVARAAAPATSAAPAPVATALPTAPAVVEPVTADAAKHPGAVLSPMVGIAYMSPEPGTPPFVVAGQAVAAGDVLLLIEAMKTFNQIKAPKAGTVTRILVASGAPVEYGEPLLILD